MKEISKYSFAQLMILTNSLFAQSTVRNKEQRTCARNLYRYNLQLVSCLTLALNAIYVEIPLIWGIFNSSFTQFRIRVIKPSMLVQNRHGFRLCYTQTRTTHAHNDEEPLRANADPRPGGNATIVVQERGVTVWGRGQWLGARAGTVTGTGAGARGTGRGSNDAAAAEL